MSLKYILVENQLSHEESNYTAQVQQVKSHDMNSIVEKMLKRGTLLTKTDILANNNLFLEVIAEIVADGESINTDLFKTSSTIKGTFASVTDAYDPLRHSLSVNLTAGKLLKDALTNVKPEKLPGHEIHPIILQVKDTISGISNDQLTPNGVLEISGSRIRIDGEPDQTGIFFINDDDNTSYKVITIVDNKPKRIVAMIPDLPKGHYTLQVKTQYGGSVLLKQTRIGTFTKSLQVI